MRLDLDEVDWDTVDDLAKRAYQAIAPRKVASLIEKNSQKGQEKK